MADYFFETRKNTGNF